jgi:hypothetical protein
LNDDLLDDFFLESFPNPERKGCPDDETLQAFSEDRLPPGNPVLSHVSACSECYREYLHYRQDWKEASEDGAVLAPRAQTSAPIPIAAPQQPRPAVRPLRGWAIAAGLAVVLGTGFYFAHEHHSAPAEGGLVASNVSPSPGSVDVDLFNAVTARGGGDDATPLEQVSLPSSLVNLSVTLPRFSQSGPYQILVSKDRAGLDVVARGTGQAVETEKKVRLTVSLDLRQTAPGTYFLATVRGSDNGTYYYPLKIN